MKKKASRSKSKLKLSRREAALVSHARRNARQGAISEFRRTRKITIKVNGQIVFNGRISDVYLAQCLAGDYSNDLTISVNVQKS